MATTPVVVGSVSVVANTGVKPASERADQNADGSVAKRVSLEVGGTALSAASPLPTTGNVGGFSIQSQVTPAVTVGAYTVGMCVGGVIQFLLSARAAGGTGLVQSLTATFASGVAPSLDVVFFNANPAASTLADHGTAAVAVADLGKVLGVVHLTDSTLLGATLPSVVQGLQLAFPFDLAAGTTLFAAVITRTAITLGATSDMIVTSNIIQD